MRDSFWWKEKYPGYEVLRWGPLLAVTAVAVAAVVLMFFLIYAVTSTTGPVQ
jgi:hypothetical protein